MKDCSLLRLVAAGTVFLMLLSTSYLGPHQYQEVYPLGDGPSQNDVFFWSGGDGQDNGSVTGVVIYGEGPEADQPVEGGTVEIMNGTGEVIVSDTTNSTGGYFLGFIPFSENYTVRARPPDNMRGEWDKDTGYLPSTSSPFSLMNSSPLEVNFKLNHYEYSPPPVHPSVEILDDSGDPLEGVEVRVDINGESYISHTNSSGVVTFYQYDGEKFPGDSYYSASLDGYDEISWREGEEVPVMSEKKEDKSVTMLVVIALLLLVFIAIMVSTLSLSRKRGH